MKALTNYLEITKLAQGFHRPTSSTSGGFKFIKRLKDLSEFVPREFIRRPSFALSILLQVPKFVEDTLNISKITKTKPKAKSSMELFKSRSENSVLYNVLFLQSFYVVSFITVNHTVIYNYCTFISYCSIPKIYFLNNRI